MRKPKFRIYSEKLKKILYFDLYDLTVLQMSEVEDDKELYELLHKRNPQVEQSTGLRDKYAEEIFAGDVVKIIDKFLQDGEKPDLTEVKRNEEKAMFTFSFDDTIYTFDEISNTDLEVVGNIHKNPELLNEENEGEND